MHGAARRYADIAGELADKQFPDLPGTPVRLVALALNDQALHLPGQLVGVAHRPPRAIGKRLEPFMLVAIEDLVAGLAGNPELPAHLAHALSLEKPSHKPKTFLHHRTLSPRHQHLPPQCEKCYPCVRYVLSPISQAAHLVFPIRAAYWVGPRSLLSHISAELTAGSIAKAQTASSPPKRTSAPKAVTRKRLSRLLGK
jgi:hypothetical protein